MYRRCERCRHSRVKCDKKWPTCSSCKQNNATCSGPTGTTNQFVHYEGKHSQTSSSTSQTIASGRETVVERVKAHTAAHGSAFSCLRFVNISRSPPPTTGQRVAGSTANIIETSSVGHKAFLTGLRWVPYALTRVEQCPALADCMDLFFSTWTNYLQGLPYRQCTDYNIYGRALRSIHRALGDGDSRNADLLAAMCILERHEHHFDPQRPLNWSRHREGIIALMKLRGPPKTDNVFDIWLTLESYAILVAHWLVVGGDDFYMADWKDAVTAAIDKVPNISRHTRDVFILETYMGYWPKLSHRMKRVSKMPWTDELANEARSLLQRCVTLASELDDLCTPILNDFFDQGSIVVLPDSTPVGKKYHFTDSIGSRYLTDYLTMRIPLNRITRDLHILLSGAAPDYLDPENLEFATKIWMFLPHLRIICILVAASFGDPFYMAYEMATGEIKEYLLSWLAEIGTLRNRLPQSRDDLDRYVMTMGLSMTGRADLQARFSRGDVMESSLGMESSPTAPIIP